MHQTLVLLVFSTGCADDRSFAIRDGQPAVPNPAANEASDEGTPSLPPGSRAWPDGSRIALASAHLRFAWDNEQGIITPIQSGDTETPSSLQLLLVTEEMEAALISGEPLPEDGYCWVSVEIDGFVPDPPSLDHQWQLTIEPGFEGEGPQFPGGSRRVTSNCLEIPVSPSQYPDIEPPPQPEDFLAFWGALSWVFTAESIALDPDVLDLLETLEEPMELHGGATIRGEPDFNWYRGFYERKVTAGTIRGYELGDGMELVGGDIVNPAIPALDIFVLPAGELPSGLYRFSRWWLANVPPELRLVGEVEPE